MAHFLHCFPYRYRSSNYCDSNSCRSFTLLKALAKSKGNLFAIAFKSKEMIPKRIKSDNFTRGNREKFNIAIANLNDWMALVVAMQFFADCIFSLMQILRLFDVAIKLDCSYKIFVLYFSGSKLRNTFLTPSFLSKK